MVEKKTVKKVAKPVVAKEKEVEKKSEPADFSGKYVQAIGRRKTAVAQVRLYEDGKGAMIVNGIKLSKYFPGDSSSVATAALKLTSHARDLNVSVITRGGGKSGQVEAVRHGISHALLKLDENYREVLSTAGLLTRDKRQVERKKPGLRKARKAPQWSKR
ncbi:MAG: 30S ribosomal protein S9 [Patescibacteria group bacterium]|jgi:small subunit ribosomal protein S9